MNDNWEQEENDTNDDNNNNNNNNNIRNWAINVMSSSDRISHRAARADCRRENEAKIKVKEFSRDEHLDNVYLSISFRNRCRIRRERFKVNLEPF